MAAYYLILLLGWLVRALPAPFARRLGRSAGRLFYHLDRRHRRIALDNLRAVFPEKTEEWRRRTARESFGWMGFNLTEFLRIPLVARAGPEAVFRPRGLEKVNAARARGKGIVFVTFHYGNWEYLGFSPRFLGFPVAVVAQEIKNPAVDGLINDIRELTGVEVLPKNESSAVLLSLLRRNSAVAIVADQRARKMGVKIDFLGRPASATAAPAVLALRSGAAVIPVFIDFDGEGGYEVVFGDEIAPAAGLPPTDAVRELTGRINRALADRLRAAPEPWMWGHRRWLDAAR